jgi:hypothetical protein
VDTVTFNFIYTEQGRRLPDRNDKLESCYRAVIAAVQSGNTFPFPTLPRTRGWVASGAAAASS